MAQDLNEIAVPIRDELEAIERALRSYLVSEVPLVQEVANYVIQNGGKRFRPILLLFAARLCGAGHVDVSPYACAIEYIHTASLLHDDVVDNATLRRGKASANAKWGNSVSVLVGDFFYCLTSLLLVRAGRLDVLELVSQAIVRTTEGEVLEIAKSSDLDLSEDDYLKIIYHKTAVLIGTSCEIGACAGNLSLDFREVMRRFGESLGMAFQLADDVLDYASCDYKFGKRNGIDFKEGKLTLPLIYTLRAASSDERRRLKELFLGTDLKEEEFQWVTGLMKRYGSLDASLDKARVYGAAAKAALERFKPSLARDALVTLADYVVGRSY